MPTKDTKNTKAEREILTAEGRGPLGRGGDWTGFTGVVGALGRARTRPGMNEEEDSVEGGDGEVERALRAGCFEGGRRRAFASGMEVSNAPGWRVSPLAGARGY